MENYTANTLTIEYDGAAITPDTINDVVNSLNQITHLVSENNLRGETIMLISLAIVKQKENPAACIEKINEILRSHVSRIRLAPGVHTVFRTSNNNE